MVAFLRRPVGGAATRGPDRRSSARFACQVPTACRPGEGRGAEVLAVIRDLSPGGVRLRMGQGFERGELLTVDLPCAGTAARQRLLACVLHATPETKASWVVGCSFIRELSERELGACLTKGISPSQACGSQSFVGGQGVLVIDREPAVRAALAR